MSKTSVFNIGTNLFKPFTSTDRVGGTATDVTSSVATEWFVRWLFSQKGRSIWEILSAHTVAQPFRGGITAFSPGNSYADPKQHGTTLLTGAKDSISVMLGYILTSMFQSGFSKSISWLSFWEFFIIVGSKTAQREILAVLNQNVFPKASNFGCN